MKRCINFVEEYIFCIFGFYRKYYLLSYAILRATLLATQQICKNKVDMNIYRYFYFLL